MNQKKSKSPFPVPNSPLILIDNGHGADTPGKCSPDRRLREYEWARRCARLIQDKLAAKGYEAVRIVPEDRDISLGERCRRVNAYCAEYGADRCLLISIHNNASGSDGKWHDACGWSGWVYAKCSPGSKRLARILFEEAKARNLLGNRSVPADRCWTANFYILRHSLCPAVLTENLFQDNRADVEYLLTQSGLETLAEMHVAALERYLKA